MLARVRASRESDLARIRVLQADYGDTLRIAHEQQGEIDQIDAQIQKLEDTREQLADDLQENTDELDRIDRELAQFPGELIDEAYDG